MTTDSSVFDLLESPIALSSPTSSGPGTAAAAQNAPNQGSTPASTTSTPAPTTKTPPSPSAASTAPKTPQNSTNTTAASTEPLLFRDITPFTQPMALPADVLADLKHRLKEMAATQQEPFNSTQRQELREELGRLMKKLNVWATDKELDAIMEGIDEGEWVRAIHGPFFKEVREIIAVINEQAAELCKASFKTDDDKKLKNCVDQNREMLIINVIFNHQTGNEPFNEELRKMIFEGDMKRRATPPTQTKK